MHRIPLFLLALTGLAFAESKPVALLPANARLAIIGDSITEQKLYSKFIETYILACAGRTDVKCFQFGWSGERADGFVNRAENDLAVFMPTVATTCYGMNDGTYVPYNDSIGATYERNMRNAIAKMQASGVKTMVLGSPGGVDTKYYTKASSTPDQYNDNLAHLRDIDQKLASEFHTGYANVHDEMVAAMTKAKGALGADYDVCGRDGVHPGSNGHLLMASAFLKGLGLGGEIGTITVDMKGAASGSEGHQATGSNGTAEVTSTRYPFCFDGDAKSGMRSILAFCDFNEKLNRFTLKVKNLESAKAKVTWGAESKEFTKEQLAVGINLAAEFSRTPFDAAFSKFMNAVGAKQAYETPMIKGMVTNFRSFTADAKSDPEFGAALETLKKKMVSKQQALDAEARKALVPVQHSIKVTAL